MRLVNTVGGYDMVQEREPVPWYRHPAFPLLPMAEYRPGDEQNAAQVSFTWLWLRVWTLSHAELELAVALESNGLNVKLIVMWLRVVVRVIPLPYRWLNWARRDPR
jgi:hypothetical protein